MKTRAFQIGTTACALLAVSGTHAAGAAQLRPLSATVAAQPVSFEVKLPLQRAAELDSLIAAQSDRSSPTYRHFLTPAQFHAAYAPSAASIAAAVASLKAQGFSVTSSGSQLLKVTGSAAAISQAFKTQLGSYRGSDGRLRIAAASLPQPTPALAQLGATVIGLATTIKPRPLSTRSSLTPDNRYSATGGYWFDDLKEAYTYPAYGVADGKGVTIATVGQADFSSADAAQYFAHERLGGGNAFGPALAPAPLPQHLLLPGADPFSASSNTSFEANLDVQQAGGSAPGATIVGLAVNGPGEPFLEAYSYLDESNVADIVSTSYGECELYFTAAYNNGVDQTSVLQAYHDLFRQGNAQGITFLFSSGDNSGKDCFPLGYFGPGTGQTYAALPGAGIWVDDPNVTGVGGTNLLTTTPATTASPNSPTVPPLPSKYVSENEIGDSVTVPFDIYGTGNTLTGILWGSGNGSSVIFPKPLFQLAASFGTTGRTSPDVSMHMGGCPNYGVPIDCGPNNGRTRDSYVTEYLAGRLYGSIGTSAAAPEFAGALAVIESAAGKRFGNVNPLLYSLSAFNVIGGYFHQGIPAYNGIVTIPAGRLGYSSIVGVGTPNVANIARLFSAVPTLASDPQTVTNP